MATLAPTLISLSSLVAGDVIRYAGAEFVVAEVLPLAALTGDAVIGVAADGQRVTCVYANANGAAELVSFGGAR
jgi:hypothetical protein